MFDKDLHIASFLLRISSVNITKSAFSADLAMFTKETFIRKPHFCAVRLLRQTDTSKLRLSGKIMIIPHDYLQKRCLFFVLCKISNGNKRILLGFIPFCNISRRKGNKTISPGFIPFGRVGSLYLNM